MLALLMLAWGIFIVDFLIYGIALYMGYWYVIPVMVMIIIIAQTLQYYNTDIF
ncbi:MAG TPA: hypothetical protein VGW78_04060 [Candidatus Babeliales bacterium]|jgi:hypothetical protein|nr:hypothetical protein [Candidatus Babeliales bacterium]